MPGATLTPLGKQLLEIDTKAGRRLAPHFARPAREVDAALRRHTARAPATQVLHANHDLTLEYLRDLARSGVRFVNRQQGSGTRLLFDSLLAAERIPPQRIHGYQSEEFTTAQPPR